MKYNISDKYIWNISYIIWDIKNMLPIQAKNLIYIYIKIIFTIYTKYEIYTIYTYLQYIQYIHIYYII